MRIFLSIIILFYFTAFSLFAYEKLPPGEWLEAQDGPFLIYYEAADNDASEALGEWYRSFLEDFADKLQVRVPDGVRVFIAPNEARFKYLTRGLPEWTGGAVFPRQRVVVLKSPRLLKNKGQFKTTALHEGVHLLTELDGKSHLPRWLSEGLAVYLSGETLYRNRVPLARAVVLRKTVTLDEIDDVLKFGPEQARVAYLQAIDMVDFLVDRYGWESIALLVKSYQNDENPDKIFQEITGQSFYMVEIAWHTSLRKRYKWWMLIEWFDLDLALWGSASMLVMVVGGITIYRRKRYLHSGDDHENPGDVYGWQTPDWNEDSTSGEWHEYEDSEET
ncbi:MAG: peptidase MA family metallohydrolase [Candidatus Electryonea clarkiae]|nr:peptidase MA family metallohydrolase [Candidatus Electryonea clarkiae]MDP8286454.1 peptidase MA family metallohydrolase [Candidatus Electryonea clarkiae]